MTDAEILDLARQHGDEDVCRAGCEEICRAFIFNSDPDDRVSVLTFARALLAAIGVAPCAGSCCDCGKGCTTDGVKGPDHG